METEIYLSGLIEGNNENAIKRGKKYKKHFKNLKHNCVLYETLKFDEIMDPKMKWIFIRGLIDSNGFISKEKREVTIMSKHGEEISKFCGIENFLDRAATLYILTFIDTNAVDFLSKLYDNATIKFSKKYKLYLNYIGGSLEKCLFVKAHDNAIDPSKKNASDEGYDLWLIEKDKIISEKTVRYDTFIQVKPPPGYHIEILPRSSLSNTGYMLANSVGLIDESYCGTLKIALTKVDEKADELTLPFKAVQMVLRKSIHFVCSEIPEDMIVHTMRGIGGFGSTN